MVGWKRVVGGHGEGEAECVFTVEVESEQPLLSDKTEGFVQGQSCRVIVLGLEYNLRNIVIPQLNVRLVRDAPTHLLYTILLHLLHGLSDK